MTNASWSRRLTLAARKRPRRSRGPLTVGFLFTIVWEEMPSTFVVAGWHGAGVARVRRPLKIFGGEASYPPLLAHRIRQAGRNVYLAGTALRSSRLFSHSGCKSFTASVNKRSISSCLLAFQKAKRRRKSLQWLLLPRVSPSSLRGVGARWDMYKPS
jgi:hypothetical protein